MSKYFRIDSAVILSLYILLYKIIFKLLLLYAERMQKVKMYKLKNTSRYVDLGVIFVLHLTRLNWSREVVGITFRIIPKSVSCC